jgi:hypothetical protein
VAKIWVHIEPSVAPDGEEAKTALTRTLKATIEKALVEQVGKALPDEKFTVKPMDMPKGISGSYNAIKVSPGLKLKVETKGSLMKVGCDLKMVFEAIKTPNVKIGNLLGSGSKGAAAENRGSGERAIASIAGDALDAIVGPLVKQVMAHPRFTSYGKSVGLPL